MEKNLTALKQEAPTDARQVRSRKALNAALLDLLAQRTFDELTIREITARAGTGYATFFRHFSTKEALLSDLVVDPIDELLTRTLALLDRPRTSDGPGVRELCAWVAGNRGFWAPLLTGGAAGLVRSEFLRQARERAAAGHGLHREDTWLPGDLALVHGVSSVIGVLTWWLRQGEDGSLEQVAMILERMVIAPITQDTAVETTLS
ncbi:TetR/AcrR family transcriptional regulator [Novosphingobium mangrovi (ex Hu et al. 2023)]|uniref:TetR/AcrR family transcriptional regulator n=1 Tax=Novosphingobium mangrovi (ex Hu et al. 2023) TaxID=2930094 RepID=A0ABT0ACM3_9SPHN|nr:TetR/AcrR family transcriptional regulator [Novosphingobium mangrovi (ex Hu et al. 2023)]MCJ1960942.1 TetR/AcrR family transcriptional regulator [Novosphingobium mangrovi (ex Hu et al. 2023)]